MKKREEQMKNIEIGYLCPMCKTGRKSVEIDPKSPFCPYLGIHNGISCGKFVKDSQSETKSEQ